jgi:hypothetical protein
VVDGIDVPVTEVNATVVADASKLTEVKFIEV